MRVRSSASAPLATIAGADAREFEDTASRGPTGSVETLCGAMAEFHRATTDRIDGTGEAIIGRNRRLPAF
jgi:hypothetical protein